MIDYCALCDDWEYIDDLDCDFLCRKCHAKVEAENEKFALDKEVSLVYNE